MNAIVYIALAIPFVGFLTRHLVVSRSQFNEAIKAGTPSPTNRTLLISGVVFIVIAVLLALFGMQRMSDWPIFIAVIVILAEGIWDSWHGLVLKARCQSSAELLSEKDRKPEPPA